MEIKEILETDNNVPSKYIIYLILAMVVVIVLLTINKIDFDITLTMIATVLTSILTSLIAAFIFNNITQNYENNKLKELRNITNKEYLLKLLNSLHRFDKTYCENWNTTIRLSKIENEEDENIKENFYQCDINYGYRKNIKNNKIKMVFYRIQSEEDKKNIPEHINLANEYEFYWIMDERDFKSQTQIDYYQITNLVINNDYINLKKQIDSNKIVYYTEIENKYLNEHLNISYDAKLLMEKEDIIQIALDVPTKDAKIEFDFSNVANEIITYGMESISFIENPIIFKKNHSWKFQYTDWLMPKNSFVFSWWRKTCNAK